MAQVLSTSSAYKYAGPLIHLLLNTTHFCFTFRILTGMGAKGIGLLVSEPTGNDYSQMCIVDGTGRITDRGNLKGTFVRVQGMSQLPKTKFNEYQTDRACSVGFTDEKQQQVKL